MQIWPEVGKNGDLFDAQGNAVGLIVNANDRELGKFGGKGPLSGWSAVFGPKGAYELKNTDSPSNTLGVFGSPGAPNVDATTTFT